MRFVVSRALVWAAVVASATVIGCSSYVRHGSSLYADGRYIEAAEVFERTEYRLTDSEPREQAEYGLYRGMTLLVLGDLRNAHRWLAYAYEVERKNPGSLRPDRRGLLDRGWFELGQRLEKESDDKTEAPTQAAVAHAPPDPPPPSATDAAPPEDSVPKPEEEATVPQ